MMVFNIPRILVSSILILLITTPAQAELPSALIKQYGQALTDEKFVDPLYDKLGELLEQHPNDPLIRVYFGATRTLKGRDSWFPWLKLSHTEQGLGTIQDGIDLLNQSSLSNPIPQRVRGLPYQAYTLAFSARVFTAVPDFFNRLSPGYDLYLTLLNDQEFQRQPFAATAWVYESAIRAALKLDKLEQAKRWLETMRAQQADHPLTIAAQQIITQAGV